MLLLSISIWVILVYSLKVSISGNPAYLLVRTVPPPTLKRAADCLESEMMPEDEYIYLFIKKFFRLIAVGSVLFFMEFAIIIYFIYTQPNFYIPWLILFKNLAMLGLGYSLHREKNENIFESVRQLPVWAMRWERISYLVTAGCFLFLFLVVNKLINLSI
jgi:hypothetical protein